MKILCIIPVFNEENRLRLLENVNQFKKDNKFNIDFLIINNGSNDRSLKIIKSSNLDYISLKKIKA